MHESPENSAGTSRRFAWIILALIAGGHLLCNLLFNPIGTPTQGSHEWLMVMLIGVVMVQPVLFATWMILGPDPASLRVPLTTAAYLLLAFAVYFVGLNVFAKVGDATWGEASFLVVPLGAFAVFTTLLMLVRKLTGWRIVHLDDGMQSLPEARQFSIRFLLGFTTMCALLLGIASVLTSSDWFGKQTSDRLAVMLSGVGFALLATFPAFIIPMLVLSGRASKVVLAALPFLWPILTLLAIEAVIAIDPTEVRSEAAVHIVLLQAGAVIAGVFTAALLRIAGYRLITVAPSRKTSADS
jgi:hypothetical protein